mgnify:CR=1 FL=1
MDKHGIASRSPDEVLRNKNLAAVCRDLAAEAAVHYFASDQAMHLGIPSAMRPARMMRCYYGAIFDRLQANDWRDPNERVVLSKSAKIILMLRGLFAT